MKPAYKESELIRKSLEKTWGNQTNDILMNMSHEFKTPLSSIQLNAQLMERLMERENEKYAKFFSKYIGRILAESNRVVEILNDTMLLFRMYSEGKNVDYTTVSTDELLKEFTLRFKNHYPNKRIDIVLNDVHRLVHLDFPVFADAMERLIGIALEVSKDVRPKVTFKVKGDRLLIHLKAPHLRMKEQELERIFEPFSTLSEFNQVDALPLRLSLIKTMLELNKASIAAHIDKEDGFVFFEVEAPLSNEKMKVVR